MPSHGRPLISRQNTLLQNVVGVVAAIVLIPIGIIFSILLRPFARPIERTPDEVARYLRDFIEDAGGEWDWDDFESNSIADPALESIRKRASSITDFGSEEGLEQLRRLLAEAESLIAA